MVCPKCGRENSEDTAVCRFCGSELAAEETFRWSELLPMPKFNKSGTDDSDEDDTGRIWFLSKKMKKSLLRISAVFLEICILVGAIFGIYIWKSNSVPDISPGAQNIVYSSEDIVMMLVKNRGDWLPEGYDEGYTSCCFLDMDFDGSPELISISYNSESYVTQVRAFRVRSCILEEIPIDYDPSEGFFDIGLQLSLAYSPDTKEMLYLAADYSQTESGSITNYGSFYIHENRIFRENYFCETVSDGMYSYAYYDEEQSAQPLARQEYLKKQTEFTSKLSDLNLRYEWVQTGDIESISAQKLAALLLRSYDSFYYDTSGLSLQ